MPPQAGAASEDDVRERGVLKNSWSIGKDVEMRISVPKEIVNHEYRVGVARWGGTA
jgi:hypothetical protein